MFGFSFKRMFGVTKVKNSISKITRIPLTRTGRNAKIGRNIFNK